jgi:N-acetylneuraminate synthase/sialic acid synthase
LPAGHVLREEDLAMKSPGDGLPPTELDKIVGRRLKQALGPDAALTLDVLEPSQTVKA